MYGNCRLIICHAMDLQTLKILQAAFLPLLLAGIAVWMSSRDRRGKNNSSTVFLFCLAVGLAALYWAWRNINAVLPTTCGEEILDQLPEVNELFWGLLALKVLAVNILPLGLIGYGACLGACYRWRDLFSVRGLGFWAGVVGALLLLVAAYWATGLVLARNAGVPM